ncbi:TonB-dependent siderophore receptor [Alteromonas sp. 5E99-2]|uniref:TonB-dependent siderophore receptor n=1 Tax=Alteromonas sp. 5E99-2 TaxID=2817683 RepID=UPI001A9905B8|nr:TonB-dependent siderophore receptor [Alteromonas sp. 5E99-2]MBO1256585.1 TonB-dependent siderophore receptor [Alteromonas sp. 5E99-2]
MKSTHLLKFPLAVIALSISSAYAQDKVDSDISESDVERISVVGQPSTFGATKSNIALPETPRSVSIISSDDFLERGALDLSATIDYTSGITGNAFGPSTRSDTFNIRGLDAPTYQDNLQVNFGFNNNTRADVYTLEQVEVLKGPASVLYGQAAPGGIISTVSKVANASHSGNEVVLTAGNNERYQASFDVSSSLGENWTGRLVGVYRESGTQVDFVDDDAIVIAPSITYENDSTTITALINYTDRESDTIAQFLPIAVTGCQSSDVTITGSTLCETAPTDDVDASTYVGDPNFNRFDSESITVSLFGSHEFNDTLSFDGTIRYRDNEADYLQTWITFPATLGLPDGTPRVLPDGTAIARSFFGGPAGSDQFAFDFRLNADFATGDFNHQVIAGVNYQDVDTFAEQSFAVAFPSAFNIFNPVYDGSEIPDENAFFAFDSSDSTTASDVYLIDHITINNLVLNLGIRYSSVDSEDGTNDQSDNETPISIGALYKTDIGLNPYISYSESFRATVGTDVASGTPLLPRTGEQFEVGFKYQPSGKNTYVTVAYFDLEEDNLVESVALGSIQPGLSLTSKGVEIEALFNAGDFSFDLALQIQDADEVDEEGVETTLRSLPDTSGSLWSTWRPSEGQLQGLELGFGVRYVGDNEDSGVTLLPGATEATTFTIETDGYTVVDFFAAYQFTDSLRGNLNVRNLGNKEYIATCLTRGDCFPGEERTVVASLAYQF